MQDEDPSEAGQKAGGALGWGGEIGGLILLAVSIVFIVGGWQLGLGEPRRLGTGAFPFLTGFVLAVLSAAICFVERRGDGLAEAPDWLSALAICAALAVFAVTVGRIGLVPGVFLTVIVASLPDRSLSWPGKAALGLGVGLGCWLVFVELVNLPVKPFVGW